MTRFPFINAGIPATPFYYYDLNLLRRTLECARRAASDPCFCLHYAVKANANPAILRIVGEAGFGADTVSGWEIEAAMDAGFGGDRILFAGVGKSDSEIRLALERGIECFNVESEPELEIISEIAFSMGATANVALRVNPDIDAHTHAYITTGLAENKFGINLGQLDRVVELARRLPAIKLRGLHFHIGSQITDMAPYIMLCHTVNRIQEEYGQKGIYFDTINVGGGLGIDYLEPEQNSIPDFDSYFSIFRNHLHMRDDQRLHFELGRSIVGQCGSLITRVLYIKEGITKRFAIVDAGMSDLIRPALYNAHHKIENISAPLADLKRYDVVGPICESSDTFGRDELLPELKRGDLLALRSAGAYGEVMASRYNCRPLPGSFFSE